MDVDPRWYEGWFEGDWLDVVVPSIPPERGEQIADFAVERLGLRPGARILDIPCGHGRVAIPLAERGFRVTGLDLSPRSLELARRNAEAAGVEVEWVEADMREPPDGPFDAALNLYTSLGYFDEEAENQRVLDGISRVLAPGGAVLIDTVNAHALAKTYRPRSWDDLGEGVLMLQEAEFDQRRSRNLSRWTIIRPDGTRNHMEHSLRVYALHELAAMLEAAGLEVESWWGGFDGAELSFDTWRLIVLARKP